MVEESITIFKKDQYVQLMVAPLSKNLEEYATQYLNTVGKVIDIRVVSRFGGDIYYYNVSFEGHVIKNLQTHHLTAATNVEAYILSPDIL